MARRYLQRIVALRVKLVIVGLLLASLLLFLVDYVGAERAWAWSRTVPFGELGAATLSTGIIGVVWEWFVRADASEQLRRTLLEIGEQQRPALARAAASVILGDDRLLDSLLATDTTDRVLRASLISASGNENLAEGLRGGIMGRVLSGEDHWENYRARTYVTDSADLLEDGGIDPFFDFTVEIRYETVLRKSVFRFGASMSRTTHAEMTEDRAFDGCWLLARSRRFYPDLDEGLFRLRYMRVAGIDLDVNSRSEQDRLVYTAESARLGELIGTRVSVEYRYSMKFDKRGHSYVMNTRVPTRRAEYELDYSRSSIVHVNVFTFLLCGTSPTVRTGEATPGRESSRSTRTAGRSRRAGSPSPGYSPLSTRRSSCAGSAHRPTGRRRRGARNAERGGRPGCGAVPVSLPVFPGRPCRYGHDRTRRVVITARRTHYPSSGVAAARTRPSRRRVSVRMVRPLPKRGRAV
ncbi:hypothetical protein [Allosalinactinospora lopnorensis]|uniref:hypothetical protein n=1 Tax=Allosalinactinospora lopnorensis TaxID=1352348 RepID=UPI000623D26A|nr:hypothetical protein [Allosalinactinospora lopnorensis]